jgi:hypothetical protein
MAGQEITLPSFLLRAAGLNIMGSVQGSVTTAGIVAELRSLAAELTKGGLAVDPLPAPLPEAERRGRSPSSPADVSS